MIHAVAAAMTMTILLAALAGAGWFIAAHALQLEAEKLYDEDGRRVRPHVHLPLYVTSSDWRLPCSPTS